MKCIHISTILLTYDSEGKAKQKYRFAYTIVPYIFIVQFRFDFFGLAPIILWAILISN